MLGVCVSARADESSGTWTGDLGARGNYYLERSTRVVAPAISASLESPDGLQIGGNYLVDAITSASLAAGARSDVRFTEIRHDVRMNMGKEFQVSDSDLRVTGNGHVSSEPDYTSLGVGLTTALSLNDRATVTTLRTQYLHDSIERVLRGVSSSTSTSETMLQTNSHVGTLDGLILGLSLSQAINPSFVAEAGYDFAYLKGFLANPYRQVMVQGVLRDEAHPNDRIRHNAYGKLAYYIRASRTAIHAIYRAYVDSWDIGALTPELRIYQELSRFTQLRFRYRHYTQTPAFFYSNPEDYTTEDLYVSADPKMSRFHNHLLGFQFRIELEVLNNTLFEFAREAVIDANIARIWNTNQFGNGIIAQLGYRQPF